MIKNHLPTLQTTIVRIEVDQSRLEDPYVENYIQGDRD